MSADILYEHAGDDDDGLEDVALVSSMPALEPNFEVSFSRGFSLVGPFAFMLMGTLASVGVSGLMTSRANHGNPTVGFADTLLLNAQDSSLPEDMLASLTSRSKLATPLAPIPIPTPTRQSSEAEQDRNAVVIVDGAPTTAATSVAPDGVAPSTAPTPPQNSAPVRPSAPVLQLR